MVRETHSEAETEALAQALAETLRPGEVLALDGGLGAGKPTFTIVNEYLGGRLPLFHFDLYRLNAPEELFDLGWEDYLDRGGVCAVEWSEKGGGYLSPTRRITITRGPDDHSRRLEIEEVGPC